MRKLDPYLGANSDQTKTRVPSISAAINEPETWSMFESWTVQFEQKTHLLLPNMRPNEVQRGLLIRTEHSLRRGSIPDPCIIFVVQKLMLHHL